MSVRSKKLKALTMALIIAMVVSLLGGCGTSADKDSGNNDETVAAKKETGDTSSEEALPPGRLTNEDITLTMWADFSDTNISNLADNLVFQELEKITGVKVEFIHPPAGEANQAFNLLLASGDLPDMMDSIPPNFPGGPDKAIKDGYFLRLNDYIDEYAPNYKERMNYNDEIRRQTITDEGNIWSFSCIQLDQEPPWSGMFIREDWLNDLNLEVPTTIEEWETMLIAFKEEKGAEGPLLISFDWKYESNSAFASAYDASVFENNLAFLNKDGQVAFGPMEDGFKDYLALLARWYDMGPTK